MATGLTVTLGSRGRSHRTDSSAVATRREALLLALGSATRGVERDLRRDWEESFGGAMPAISAVAVGADTDNTGESVEAWFSDIVFAELP